MNVVMAIVCGLLATLVFAWALFFPDVLRFGDRLTSAWLAYQRCFDSMARALNPWNHR